MLEADGEGRRTEVTGQSVGMDLRYEQIVMAVAESLDVRGLLQRGCSTLACLPV